MVRRTLARVGGESAAARGGRERVIFNVLEN